MCIRDRLSSALDHQLSKYAISNEVISSNLVEDLILEVKKLRAEMREGERKDFVFICSKFTRAMLAELLNYQIKVFSLDEVGSRERDGEIKLEILSELNLEAKVQPRLKAVI